MATSGTYYFDTASFSSATSIYTDEALTLALLMAYILMEQLQEDR